MVTPFLGACTYVSGKDSAACLNKSRIVDGQIPDIGIILKKGHAYLSLRRGRLRIHSTMKDRDAALGSREALQE
jgi:hypothetical protein